MRLSDRYDQFPFRPDRGTEPLITAQQAYPEFERLALGAKSELLFAMRVFHPRTKLRSREAAASNVKDWGALIADTTRRGVSVRILLTDFEPMIATDLHQSTWDAMSSFLKDVDASGDPRRFQVIAGLHEGEFGNLVRLVVWPVIRRRLDRMSRRLLTNSDLGKPDTTPDLEPLVRKGRGNPDPSAQSPPRMWPATHHQKIAVADSRIAIIGGLDIDERRYDDPDHSRPGHQTWHDVSLLTRGDVARDIRDHVVACWNRDTPRFNARLTSLGAPRSDLPPLVSAIKPGRNGTVSEIGSSDKDPSVRLVRTLSRRRWSPFAFGPSTAVGELESAHIDLIHNARRLIYLETQFLRSPVIARALAHAARRQKHLRLILLLPAAPDDVAFDGNTGVDARMGEWLQVKAIERIMIAFGDRFGAFSLARSVEGHETGERDAVQGREIAYVHAKVAIADGRKAIVSSANLNGRSMRWDTEAGLIWSHAAAVGQLQERLWRVHLREGYDTAVDPLKSAVLEMWRAAAKSEQTEEESPQVVPYPLARARRFARWIPFIPKNMV